MICNMSHTICKLKIGSHNINGGALTKLKLAELVNEIRKVDIFCVQEVGWKMYVRIIYLTLTGINFSQALEKGKAKTMFLVEILYITKRSLKTNI